MLGRRGKRECIRAKEELKFPNIPEEILLEILSRLPLKSLSRFMSVSKQWRSLISDISDTKTGRHMVLAISDLRGGSFTLHSIDDEEADVKSVGRPWKKSSSLGHLRIFGSCNGLLLMGIDQDLFLWNPLTRYFKKVLSYDRLRDGGYDIVSGLCYDSSTNEYKAVMALSQDIPDSGGEYVVVGSFRSKSWTGVCFPYHVSTLHSGESGPVVNGKLHWFASKKNSGGFLSPRLIVYFDPKMNNFEEVPMPHPKREGGDVVFGLGALNGCLSITRWDHLSIGQGNVEVLAMTEYGVEKSWAVMFTIPNLTFSLFAEVVPLCCTKNGEALIKTGCDDWHIRAYNPADNSQRRILIRTGGEYFDAVTYKESLVRPTSYDSEVRPVRTGEGKRHACNISFTALQKK